MADLRTEREALAYRDLMRRLRTMHADYASIRERWAKGNSEVSAARAVSYQGTMNRLNNLIHDAEKIAEGEFL